MPVPRIAPATARDMGRRNASVARRFARRLRVSGLPNVFTTLARSRNLFHPYMSFAYQLMPGGSLPRDVTELLILRVAVNTDSDYEWHHHSRIGLRVGLTAEDLERVKEGPSAEGWTREQGALVQAADELHEEHRLSDETWDILRERYDGEQLIELCMLVGNYEMLSMVLNTLRVQIEEEA